MKRSGEEDCGILDHKVVETRGCGETEISVFESYRVWDFKGWSILRSPWNSWTYVCNKVRVLDSFFVVSFVVVISFSHDSTLHFIIYMKNFLSRNLDTNFIFLIHSDIKILLSILEKQNLLVLLQVIMRNFEDNIFVM